jgi:hypothetical protein
LSPDGRQIVYAAVKADGSERLWLRALYSQLEQPAAQGPRARTHRSGRPTASGFGFFSANSLKKIRVSSGLVQVIAANVVTKGARRGVSTT